MQAKKGGAGSNDVGELRGAFRRIQRERGRCGWIAHGAEVGAFECRC